LNGSLDLDPSSEYIGIDTTKSLRARFESLKDESQQPKERTPRPKVNRFVVSTYWCLLYSLIMLAFTVCSCDRFPAMSWHSCVTSTLTDRVTVLILYSEV
jgi:hypothetical protein